MKHSTTRALTAKPETTTTGPTHRTPDEGPVHRLRTPPEPETPPKLRRRAPGESVRRGA